MTPTSQKLWDWVNEQVDEIRGPVPIDTIFHQAATLDEMVKILPRIEHRQVFYSIVFEDESNIVFAGEEE